MDTAPEARYRAARAPRRLSAPLAWPDGGGRRAADGRREGPTRRREAWRPRFKESSFSSSSSASSSSSSSSFVQL